MGAGCSTEKSAGAVPPSDLNLRVKSRILSKTGSGHVSGGTGSRTREELAAQFIAEFPADNDPDAEPEYPEGSREATFLKIFALLDSERRNYLEIPTWKEYCLQEGLTTEALGKEVLVIVAEQSAPGDPQVSPRQFVRAMVNMVAHMDDHAFGLFVAKALEMYRARVGSRGGAKEQASQPLQPAAPPAEQADEKEPGAEAPAQPLQQEAQLQRQQEAVGDMEGSRAPSEVAAFQEAPVTADQKSDEVEALEELQVLETAESTANRDIGRQQQAQAPQARAQRVQSEGMEVLDA